MLSRSHFLSLLGSLFLAASSFGQWTASTEYVICSGGPALRQWEEYRILADQHDKFWANFTVAAHNRMKGLRAVNPNMRLTWLIYRPGYVTRAQEDSRKSFSNPLFKTSFSVIESQAAEVGASIVWFSSTQEFCRHLNNRSSGKMSGFEYFGHSNSMAFLFDYSNNILGCSQCYLHSKYLSSSLKSGIFMPDAHVQSWGCNTGDHMSGVWKQVTGHSMLGATKTATGNGKTNYGPIADWHSLPVVNGSWTE